MCSSCTSSIVTYRCPASFYPWRHLRINGPRPTARPAELLPTAFHQRPGKPDPWFGRYRRSPEPWEPWSRPSIPKMTTPVTQGGQGASLCLTWLDLQSSMNQLHLNQSGRWHVILAVGRGLSNIPWPELDFQAGIPNQPENGVFRWTSPSVMPKSSGIG